MSAKNKFRVQDKLYFVSFSDDGEEHGGKARVAHLCRPLRGYSHQDGIDGGLAGKNTLGV